MDILQKSAFSDVGPTVSTSLEPLTHYQNVASLILSYRYNDFGTEVLWAGVAITKFLSEVFWCTLYATLPRFCKHSKHRLRG